MVSIILPTFNGFEYIKHSIDSCIRQTHRNIELIIVDDGSTDETPSIIRSYKDRRIKYIKHRKNKGLPGALNTGFSKATGKYLTWTSDDNYYAEDAIEKMIDFLKKNSCVFVYCDFYKFDEETPSEITTIKLPDMPKLEESNDIGACFLYSKKVKDVVGDYDTEFMLAEDYDYWIRVSKKFSMCHLSTPLYFYRVHKRSLNLSRHYEAQVAGLLVKIKNGININKAINSFMVILAKKYAGPFMLNKILIKARFYGKIAATVESFKSGKITAEEAKNILKDITDKKRII